MRATMAVRASAVTGRPSSTPSKSAPLAPTRRTRRPSNLPPLLLQPSSTTAAVSLLTLFCTPGSHCEEAKALTFPKEDIISSLSKVENTLDQVEKVSTNVLDYTVSAFKVLYGVLKPTIDVTAPMVQGASKEAVKAASPILSEASKQAQGVLQDAGVDPRPVLKTVAGVAEQSTKIIEGTKPVASSAFETLSSDPSALLGTAGALFLAYLLLPAVWSGISFTFRGYKGDLSPAKALDLVCSESYVIVDIRSEKDKIKAGIPRLPSNAKNSIIYTPLEELPSKLKGLVRDVKKVEAEIVALKISYLKRVGKGSNIVILDSYSDSAKTVARLLNYIGFKNVWVVTDGFSGRKGWIQSRLSYDSYTTNFAEILSPSRVIPAASRFGTTGSRGSQRFLTGKVDA